jgi:hypothetical protein
MAITVASATPRVTPASTNVSASVTTASFTAPAGAMLIACVCADESRDRIPIITDSIGGDWANVGYSRPGNEGALGGAVATASMSMHYPASGVARTITATFPTPVPFWFSLHVWQITTSGSVLYLGSSNHGSAINSATINPAVFTSRGSTSVMIVTPYNGQTIAANSGADTSTDLTLDTAMAGASDNVTWADGFKALSVTPGAQTFNITSASSTTAIWRWVVVEVTETPPDPVTSVYTPLIPKPADPFPGWPVPVNIPFRRWPADPADQGNANSFGDATLDVTAGLTADGVVGTSGDASLTATAGLTAAGVVGRFGAATLTATAGLTAAGAVGLFGTATLSTTAGLSGDGMASIIGAAKVGTVAEIASGTTVTGNYPAGFADGDYAIAVFAVSDSTANFTGPSGWSLIAGPLSNAVPETLVAYGKRFPVVAGAVAPAGSWVTAGRGSAFVTTYANVDSTTPLDGVAPSTVNNTTATSTIVIPSVTPTTVKDRVFSAAMADTASANTITPPPQMMQLAITTGTGRRAAIAEEYRDAVAATGTRTWGISGSLQNAGLAFVLKPTSGAAQPTGDASFTETAGFSAAGIVGTIGNATLSMTAGLSATGILGAVGVSTLTETAGFSAAGILGKFSAATLSTTAGFSATGAVGTVGAATLTTTAGLTAAGQVGKIGAAALTVTAGIQTVAAGQATLTVTAGLTAVGIVGTQGSASLTAQAAISGAGIVGTVGSATLSTTAGLAAAGIVGLFGTATLTVTAGMVANTGKASDAALTVTAGLTAAGVVARFGTATLVYTAGLSAAGFIARFDAETLTSTAGITATGAVGISTGATLPATAGITAAGAVGRSIGASLTAIAGIVSNGSLGKSTGASLPTVAGMLASGIVAVAAPVVYGTGYADAVAVPARGGADVMGLAGTADVVPSSSGRADGTASDSGKADIGIAPRGGAQ